MEKKHPNWFREFLFCFITEAVRFDLDGVALERVINPVILGNFNFAQKCET